MQIIVILFDHEHEFLLCVTADSHVSLRTSHESAAGYIVFILLYQEDCEHNPSIKIFLMRWNRCIA
jgi:hypothetical protein